MGETDIAEVSDLLHEVTEADGHRPSVNTNGSTWYTVGELDSPASWPAKDRTAG